MTKQQLAKIIWEGANNLPSKMQASKNSYLFIQNHNYSINENI